MKTKKWIATLLLLCLTGGLFANQSCALKHVYEHESKPENQPENKPEYTGPAFTRWHIDSMLNYARLHGYNEQIAIFINLQRHSGGNRFFLVDLDNENTLLSGLCTHGKGNIDNNEVATFSNVRGSRFSSDGLYKIGHKYRGEFGTAYKLYGLCQTNCNAYNRCVVLHGNDCVPAYPVPYAICQSWGCPTLSPAVLKQLIPYLDASEKPVLLWIY